MRSNSPKIALFGGTFDPVHRGHIEPLLQLADLLDWQQIHLIPTYSPPHKAQPIASDQQRLTMLRQIALRDTRLQVNPIEIEQKIPSRTYRTLQGFAEQYPNYQRYFVLGMDSYLQLPNWHYWQELNQSTSLVVLPRKDYSLEQASQTLKDWQSKQNNILFAETKLIDISATVLREQLKRHNSNSSSILNLLYPETLTYIREQKLYHMSE